MNKNNETSIPWYKIPIMWLIFGIPFLTVIAGLTTVYIATTNADSFSTDYVKHKLMYVPDTQLDNK